LTFNCFLKKPTHRAKPNHSTFFLEPPTTSRPGSSLPNSATARDSWSNGVLLHLIFLSQCIHFLWQSVVWNRRFLAYSQKRESCVLARLALSGGPEGEPIPTLQASEGCQQSTAFLGSQKLNPNSASIFPSPSSLYVSS
jgi:hypothetical protein